MKTTKERNRRGNVAVLVAILMPILAGFGAFAIDVGYIAYSDARLQAGADAAALAAVEELPGDQATLDAIVLRYAGLNQLSGGSLQITVEGGTWDNSAATFTATSLSEASAVRVTLQQTDSPLNFGSLLGKSTATVGASAVATKSVGTGSRFLIDDEMIDTDVPAIQSLAASTGKTPDEMLRARGFNQGKQYGGPTWTWEDNFIDLPAGVTLSLPTGQGTSYSSNDAGLFDFDHPQFPFTDDTSFMEFLMYSETGNDPSKWGTDYSNIRSQLDPLNGNSPVYSNSSYASFVNPDFVYVSPVTYSDLSTQSMQSGVPRVTAKGLRRGLIAFKIMAVGADVDGGGSTLPKLDIMIVDPATIDPDDVRHYSLRPLRLVQ